jgi:putative transposase
MSRKARFKPEHAIFHIICKSITEVTLFKDNEDKEKYLSLVKKYKTLYKVNIYGYCLMDNHTHLLVDSNGADISKVMHGINFCYATYYNKKHKREGHLFKNRFKSKVVHNERYLKTVSLYIHNNPTAILGFKDCPEKYAFSSLGIYIGKSKDHFGIVDYELVMSLFGENLGKARKAYCNLVFKSDKEKLKKELEVKDEKTEFASVQEMLVRDFKSKEIITFIAKRMNVPKVHLHMKYSRKLVSARALTVVLMRSLCNFKSSEICDVLGNITRSRVSKLSTIGIELIGSDERYENIIEDFIINNKCKCIN